MLFLLLPVPAAIPSCALGLADQHLRFSTENGNLTSWFKVQKLILRHHDCICCLRVCGAPGRMAFTPWLGNFSYWIVSLTHLRGWSCPLQVPSSIQSTRHWFDSLKEPWAKLVPHCREGLNDFFVLVNSKHFYLFFTDPLLPISLPCSPNESKTKTQTRNCSRGESWEPGSGCHGRNQLAFVLWR